MRSYHTDRRSRTDWRQHGVQALRTGLWLMLCALLLAPATVSATGPAAQESQAAVQIFSVTQEDRNGDGQPDITEIRCSIVTPNDRVLVYDGGRNMRRSDRWEQAADFSDDTWVFDIGGNGGSNQATLIIVFSTEGGDSLARIYDQTNANPIQYEASGNSVQVITPPYPSLIIRARGPWLNPDGSLNYNLTWQFDGPAANREQAARLPDWFALNGDPDLEGESRDADQDGVPEFLWSTLLAKVPFSEGFPRTGAAVNSGRQRPADIKNIVFWPLLNRPDNPQGRNYFDTPLFVGIDWQTGLITTFSFLGYPIEEGYHINSLGVLQRNRLNVLNFENPMAYYDLAEDRDGFPELFIRTVYMPPGSPLYVSGGPTATPLTMIQYSWNQRNHPALLWDYKVDIAGANEISDTVRLGDMTIKQVPHAELPGWVWRQRWGFATFIAFESGDGYFSSEGLYEWSTMEGVQSYGGISAGSLLAGPQDYTSSDIRDIPLSDQRQRTYLTGRSVQPPADLYHSILTGFRGEYGDINGPINLYFSPIDRRLHLLGVSHGVYNAGNNRRVEYHNLDADPYIDSWRVFAGNQLVAELHQSREFLIYGGDDQVQLWETYAPWALFRTRPPANHQEWNALGDQLTEHARDIAGDDLVAMARQFDEPALAISNAAMREYRPSGQGGFRFVLELQPGFQVQGADLLGVAGKPPGVYVVTYNEGFTSEPLTPPALTATLAPSSLTRLTLNRLPVTIHNVGRQDVPQATLELWATPPARPATLVTTQTVALLAQLPTTAHLEWVPPASGEWELFVRIVQPNGEHVSFAPVAVTVAPGAQPTPAALIGLSSSWSILPIVGLGLLICAGLAALLLWQQSAPDTQKGSSQEGSAIS